MKRSQEVKRRHCIIQFVENSRTGITWKKKDQWLGWYGVWFGKMARGKFGRGWKFLYVVVVVTLLFMFVKMY